MRTVSRLSTAVLASSIALALWPAAAWAQAPVGAEFLVNTQVSGEQYEPTIASDAGGNFVVAWTHSSSTTVRARRFAADGTPRGTEFVVSSRGGISFAPVVAMHPSGAFVVAWSGQPTSSYAQIFGRRFDAAGAPLGADFQVSEATTFGAFRPGLAMAPDGTFIAVWAGNRPGRDNDVFARRFDAVGQPLGAEFAVNTNTGDEYDGHPAVAIDDSGAFLVVWASGVDDTFHIIGQAYAAGGSAVGANFVVHAFRPETQYEPAVARLGGGEFVVAWSGRRDDTSATMATVLRRVSAAGALLGAELEVYADTSSVQLSPSLTVHTNGDVTVAWTRLISNDYDVMGQRVGPDGTRRGDVFMLNTFAQGDQDYVSLATGALGGLVAAWSGQGQADPDGVFARRFVGILAPEALAVDSAGNGVWEPGETAGLRPTWRNVTGAAASPVGHLANLAGPAGALYTITDATGSYGTLPDGAAAACGDCYAVAVDDPAARPAPHWDATVSETLDSPPGAAKSWRLHLGRSFTDVAITSPFYRFVETLLHNGVTGGCTATEFCPDAATTRDQMAVFVLAAREGAGYAPPACTTPMFNDVPASSPFCRFIEELARRAVVGGCGVNPLRYCPAAPVTREQMAVFALRTLDPALDPPACTTPVFADVPASSPFCRWIEELARRHVVAGCGGGNYCPGASVTREQMGVFISATFGLALYGP